MVSSFERQVRAGEEIRLRIRFLDDLGDSATASGVLLHIWDNNGTVDFDDVSGAYSSSISPTYVGDGVYQYDFSLPISAEAGTWKDGWYGMLNQQEIEQSFEFTVVAGGDISQLGNQIYNNNIVEVTLASGVRALDGTYLGGEETIEFLTTTTPAYSDIRKVRLSSGGFLTSIYDDTLQTAIVEASVEADALNFNTTDVEEAVFYHARREYVSCLAASMVMQNLASNTLKVKTLADLHVEYDTGALQRSLDRILDCVNRWQAQVIAGGSAIKSRQPKRVTKGICDPDRPAIGRLWYSTGDDSVSRRVPGGNVRVKPSGSRRYTKTFVKRYW